MRLISAATGALIVIAVTICLCACAIGAIDPLLCIPAIVVFVLYNIFPSLKKRPGLRLRILSDGAELLCAFLAVLSIFTPALIVYFVFNYGIISWQFLVCALIFTGELIIIFWNGIIRVYCTSSMIGMKWRIIGIICGFVFVLNIIVLVKIIRLAFIEVNMEQSRYERNLERRDKKVCSTRYPLLLVHGVFFRDIERFNYWGRIPDELIANGADIYYGEQQSALDIESSAAELAERIRQIVAATGCQKVNIIAHSKGGLDCRYAIDRLGVSEYVASLTTINTPHRGCVFAEWLLGSAPVRLRDQISDYYNNAFKKLGDPSPDFIGAINGLCASSCARFNEENPDIDGIYYQSVGSKINKPLRSIFPLTISYLFARHFDGPNDGLVSVDSARWGRRFIYLESKEPDGISHGDMIDLMRHDKPDFDVREFYVTLVSELKQMGL